MRFERPAHKKILEILEDGKSHHKDEFRDVMSYDGLRGRISELNKWGYVIRRTNDKGSSEYNGDYFKCITVPIRETVNDIISVNLKPYNDKVEIVPLSDIHQGNPCFTEKGEEKLDGYLNYILDKDGCYTILVGDLIESSNPHASFKLKTTPQEQYDWILDKFMPLADKKKIISILGGNHENWIYSDTGFDIIKTMSQTLRVPYLGDSGYIGMKVNKQFYTMYATHPKTAVTRKSSKIKMLEDIGSIHDVDVIACAHIHSIITEEQIMRKPNFVTGEVDNKKQLLIGTGSFLEYGDYAEQARYKPEKMGAPKIILRADRFDMHVSK